MLQSYRRLLDVPRFPSLLLWSLLGRLHIAALPIAVTFLVAGWTGSYAMAGLVSGGLTVGTALAGPIRGRMADRRPADRVLLTSAVAYATGLTAIAVLPARLWWVAVPLAVVTGLFLPPAGQIARSLWPRIAEGPTRQTIFAAEATLQELTWVVGPLLAAGIVALAGGRIAVGTMAAIACAGALGFAWALRRAGRTVPPGPQADPAGQTGRSLLAQPQILLVIGACLVLVGGLGAVDISMVAWARELGVPGYAGALMAVYAIGSGVGGLVAGGLSGRPHLSRRAVGAAAGALLLVPLLPPVAHLPSPLLITPALFVAGLSIAPTIAALTERLGELAPGSRRGEAFGWMAAATTGGISVSSPLTGWLIDVGDVAAGIGGAASLALCATVITVFVRRAPARAADEA